MIYVVGAAVGILACLNQKSRVVFFIVAFYAFSIFAFNSDNPDLLNYQNQYIGNFFGFNEPVYIWLASLCSRIGMNFWMFRGLVAVIGLTLVGKTIYDYSPLPNFSMFLFILYPLVIDVVQIRFFLSYAFIVHSIRYIIEYRNERSILPLLKFAVSYLLASGIHYSSMVYIILVFLFFNTDANKYVYYLIIPVIAVLFLSNIASIAEFVSTFLVERKVDRWLLGTKDATTMNIVRVIVSRGAMLLVPFLFCFFKRREDLSEDVFICPDGKDGKNAVKRFYRENRIFFLATLYTELFCFLELTVASEYERVTRPGLVWGGILATRILYRMDDYNRRFCSVLWAFVIAAYFISQMMFQGVRYTDMVYFDYVFRRVMENNMFYHL